MHRTAVALLSFLTVAGVGVVAADTTAVAGAPAVGQLPDLVADPPNRVELSVDVSAADRPSLLVRFDGFVHNQGPGALDLRATRASARDPMQVAQRIFQGGGPLYNDQPSDAEMEYSDADGHHHWHLQRAVRYSLVLDADREQFAAPAEKVGFCLVDSEKADDGIGPDDEVYSDESHDNCEQLNPGALSVFQGVSAGWRDIYTKGLAFQWVDVSDVLPGSYRVRVDMDPDGVIEEANEVNVPAYAYHPTVIPGYNAKPLQAATAYERAVELTLPAEAWQEDDGPALPAASFAIVDQPEHGTLSSLDGAKVTYTPDPGWRGVDTFGYTAADPSSAFPRNAAVATAAVSVGLPAPTPTVTISGAPSSMVAGTSVKLQATVLDDAPQVSWSATAGTIDADGLYVAPAAPPADGSVTIAARSAASATASVTIAVTPKPDATPKPNPGVPEAPVDIRPALSTIHTMRMGQLLTANVRPNVAGRVRITAFAGRRRLGMCTAPVAGGQTFTCRLRLPPSVALRAPIRLVAGLRSGRTLTRRARAAASIPATRMRASFSAGAAVDVRSTGAAGPRGGATRTLFCPLTPR